MRRKLLAILILTGITLQVFNKMLILIDYRINKSYIAATFCENKNKPLVHCEGRCHLSKQLKENERNETAPLNNIKTTDEIFLFTSFDKIQINHVSEKQKPSVFYLELKSFFNPAAVFHPPQA